MRIKIFPESGQTYAQQYFESQLLRLKRSKTEGLTKLNIHLQLLGTPSLQGDVGLDPALVFPLPTRKNAGLAENDIPWKPENLLSKTIFLPRRWK